MKKEGSLANGFRLYGFSLLLVQLLAACSPTKEQALAPADNNAANMTAKATQPIADDKLVVVFGDSLYAGYNLQQDQGFAPILEQALSKQGVKAHVVNAGVSGDTSADGLARLAFGLDGLPRKPDLVLVGLGGNDMLRGLSPQATRTNIDAILTELAKRGIPAMLTGMMASPNMGPDYAAAFNPIYPDLAKKHGVPLYPFFLDGVIGQRSLLLPDGIHPNPQGVQRITTKVAPLVARQLGE
ncbi:arylesterase [Sphingobium yanoikuyae]|jgi:acyl-CoA thioesterase-1|uniref:Arylesterase n=1 Tax=Sphingobium yanoikuyae TaxID=13690 RepID=A0A2D1R5J9_SPHYA|nr:MULTISPECIES: arylesterase [Sphingobium]ATP20023.1 arylesterase [Sphingobium yanoikuyae]MDH2133459.1 arylesterase [Sphingobium yanoikuyae]MDH2152540.1 arylesterase [Sphingobium yanoikuyae]MDH2169376.1 arylesterase [Sphingobium yanoikuyae]TKV35613.1 arylesterase [Sphingobium sp. MP9-4]